VVFPRRAGKPKAGDASAEELSAAAQLRGPLLPMTKAAPTLEKVAVTEEMKVGPLGLAWRWLVGWLVGTW
jgi:large subunit ribosomal protein L13e